MSKLQMYAPFSKVLPTDDGGAEVWGFATLERVDKANEIADFEGTVKAFEEWSNEIAKYSQGKSMGNIREMHQPKAVAKLIHWEPSETTVNNEDGTQEVVKGIYVGTKIPASQTETIEKVNDGILTGFSIGGGYAKRWKDIEKNAMRFIPKLTELSYVDNPCVEGAAFTMIKAAITENGPVEAETFEPKMYKAAEEERKQKAVLPPPEGKEMQKEMKPEELVKALVADAMKKANGEQVDNPNLGEIDKDTLTKTATLLESAINHLGEVSKRDPQEGDTEVKPEEEVMKAAKEVLNSILEEVKKSASTEQTNDDQDAGNKEEEAQKAAEAEELQKRGAAISKKRHAHLQHAQKHLQAAIDGSDYTAEDHAEFEAQMSDQEPSGMEQETNAEKGTFFGDLRKGIVTDVSEALNKFEGLGELAKATDLSKAVEIINGVAKGMETVLERLEAMEKRLKIIEEQPVQGGPISNPSAVTKLYQMGQQDLNKDAIRQEIYQELLKSDEVPLGARQVLAKNMALQAHPLVKRQ